MKIGINKVMNHINLIEISPLVVMGRPCICVGFEEEETDMRDLIHLALIFLRSPFDASSNLVDTVKNCFADCEIYARIHSECLLSETLYSDNCDCRLQLKDSLQRIIEYGCGVLIYLRQEGRGIGLRNKLSCLSLQSGYFKANYTGETHGSDSANIELGFGVDERNYDAAIKFLKILAPYAVKIITGNPVKIDALKSAGFETTVLSHSISNCQLNEKAVSEIQEKMNRGYIYSN